MSLAPVPSDQGAGGAACANCSAPLSSDQRYCLACGRPVSPASLAFLDVLSEAQPHAGAQGPAPLPGGVAGSLVPAYAAVIEPASGPLAWLRRYSGLFGLLTVLGLATIAGLLVGHWVTQSKAPSQPSQQVLKVEGLSGLASTTSSASTEGASGSSTPASKTPAGKASTPATGAAASKEAAKAEAHEAEEAKAIEKAPPAKPVKVTSTKLKKLGTTTGRKHEEELNALGAQPIETGG